MLRVGRAVQCRGILAIAVDTTGSGIILKYPLYPLNLRSYGAYSGNSWKLLSDPVAEAWQLYLGENEQPGERVLRSC